MKAPKRRSAKPFNTNTPRLSDATIDRIRDAARRYVRAGGSIFPSTKPSDQDEHIANVVREMHARQKQDGNLDAFDQALDETDFSQPGDQERLYNEAWKLVTAHADAGFLFGAFVGLELAALTLAPHTQVKGGGR